MQYGALALPLFLLILTVVTLWILIGSRGPWYVKVFLISLLPASTVTVWIGIHSYLGWPAPLPKSGTFILVATSVREPDAEIGDPGAVYLWVRIKGNGLPPALSWIGYQPDPRAPRAYQMSYTRERHKAAANAQKRLGEGATVAGEFKDIGEGKGQDGNGSHRQEGRGNGTEGRGAHGPSGDAQGTSGQDGNGGNGTEGGEAVFYDLPPAGLPPKDTQE